MKTVSISGSLRGNVGKKDAKKLRKEGFVPCVIYGGEKQLHFSVNEKNFKNILYTPEVCFVKVNIEQEELMAIIQDVQYHPVTDKILHVDFLQLSPNKPIVMQIPVKLNGTAPGVLKGGRLALKLKKLKIKSLPENMPDNINLDISKLDIGNTIKVNDIKLDNLTLLDPPNTVVVGVYVTRAVTETEETKQVATTTAEKTADNENKNK
ncbi:MAG TPA: 50S ribosomal protein L25/general stress protein Ctc [Bacteroidales bacterium]|nr:50S ribosomal protein L25/general stress protein Ctc [Bacteroidales bacterium]